MNCWHCERPAHGTCCFCGRALCKEHVQSRPHIEELYRDKGAFKALVVADAVWCGVCRPRKTPSRCRS